MEFLKTIFRPDLVTAISPPVGEWVIVSEYNTPVRAILNDAETGKTITITVSKDSTKAYEIIEEDGFTSLEMTTWPEQQHTFPLVFTELFLNKENGKNAVYSSGPEKGKNKYDADDLEVWKYSRAAIGTRNETDVKTLHRLEIHPVAIEFLCQLGGSYVVVVQVATKVLNPIAALQVKNFLTVVNGLITEAIGNWGRTMTFAAARKINTDDRLQIKIGNEFYLDVINRKLRNIGLEVDDVSTILHFAADISENLITSEERIIEAENASIQADFEVQKREKLNTIKKRENDTDAEYKLKIVKGIQEAECAIEEKRANTAKAYVGVNSKLQYLNIGASESSFKMSDILAALGFGNKKEKGGSDAS